MRMADGPRPRVFREAVLSGDVKRAAEGGALWDVDERRYAGAWKVADVAAQVAINRNDLTKTELSFKRGRGVFNRRFKRPKRPRHVAMQLPERRDFLVGRLQTLPKKQRQALRRLFDIHRFLGYRIP